MASGFVSTYSQRQHDVKKCTAAAECCESETKRTGHICRLRNCSSWSDFNFIELIFFCSRYTHRLSPPPHAHAHTHTHIRVNAELLSFTFRQSTLFVCRYFVPPVPHVVCVSVCCTMIAKPNPTKTTTMQAVPTGQIARTNKNEIVSKYMRWQKRRRRWTNIKWQRNWN